MTESEYLKRPDAQGHLKVMEILRKWDPIGVITENNMDEYDMYSAGIVRMLDDKCSAEDLKKHLEWIQQDRMGLKPNGTKDQEIGTELVEWWAKWKKWDEPQ